MWIAISVEVGPGIKLGGADVVEKLIMRQPAPAPDNFVFHHPDVRRGTTERGRPKLEKQHCQFAQPRPLRARFGCVAAVMHRMQRQSVDAVFAPTIADGDSTMSSPDIIGR